MNAQFATIEAMISLMAVLAMMTFTENVISNQNANLYSSRKSLAENIAVFDFVNQLMQNLTAKECLNRYALGDKSCMNTYLRYYKSTYGLTTFNPIPSPGSYQNSWSMIRCFPYNGSAASEMCIEAG